MEVTLGALLLITLIWSHHHETVQIVVQNQQKTVLGNCVEDAQKERIRGTYAWRHPPVSEAACPAITP